MDLTSFARVLGGAKRLEGSGANRPTNVSRMTGTAVADSADGKVLVRLDAQVFSGDGSQYVELPTSVNVREGDLVYVDAVGADGKGKTLAVSGAFGGGDRQQGEIDAATAATALEAPYTEVEWVESDGVQMCHIFHLVTETTGFDVDFEIYNDLSGSGGTINTASPSPTTNYGYLFGVFDDGAKNALRLSTYKRSGVTRSGEFTFGSSIYDARLYMDGRRQQCSLRNGIYTAPDGTTQSVEQAAFESSMYLILFAAYHAVKSTGYDCPCQSKLYSFRLYDGDELAADIVGAVRKADSMPGLYDKIEGHFYPCDGLACGAEVGDVGEAPSIAEGLLSSNPVVTDERVANSRVWLGSMPWMRDLADGQTITFATKYATVAGTSPYPGMTGSSSNVLLDLELADGRHRWAPVYRQWGAVLTTEFGAGQTMRLTYRENRVVGTACNRAGFYMESDYNTNTNTYDRRLHNDNVKAATAITSGHLICGDAGGYRNVAAGATFDLAYPVLYASAAIKAAASAKTAYEAIPGVNFSTSGTVGGGAAGATVWLRGTVSGNEFAVADDGSPYLTCEVPTTRDGCCYIPLGLMTSATAGYFATSSQLYAFLGGYFGPRSVREVCRYVTELEDGIMVHPEGDETTGWSIREALELLRGGVSYIKAWLDGTVPKVRIGTEDTGHIVLDSDGIDFMDAAYSVARIARRTGGAVLSIGQAMLASGQSAWLQAYTDSGTVNCGVGASHGQSGAAGMSASVEARAGAGVAQVYAGGKSLTVNDTYNGTALMGTYDVPLGHFGKLARCRIDIAYGTLTVPANSAASITLDWQAGGFDDGNYIATVTPMAMPNGFNNVGWCVTNRTATQLTVTAWNSNSYAVTQLIGCIGVDSRYGTVV